MAPYVFCLTARHLTAIDDFACKIYRQNDYVLGFNLFSAFHLGVGSRKRNSRPPDGRCSRSTSWQSCSGSCYPFRFPDLPDPEVPGPSVPTYF